MHIIAIGGSDAGISAALRARELEPDAEVTVVVADAYPNFSICGIPYYISGEVTHWRNLAHRSIADLEATGMGLRLDTIARRIDVAWPQAACHRPTTVTRSSSPTTSWWSAPGPCPSARPSKGSSDPRPSAGRRRRPPAALHGRHLRRHAHPGRDAPASALIVGGGYIGLEMAEALVARGLEVTQMEQLAEVLPTVDPELGALVHAELSRTTGSRCSPARRSVRSPGRHRGQRSAAGGGHDHSRPGRASRRRHRPGRRGRAPGHRAGRLGRRRFGGLWGHRRGPSACAPTSRTSSPPETASSPTTAFLGDDLPPARHHRPQAGARRRVRTLSAGPGVRRQPRHPGGQDLRPRRRPHRTARPRGGRRRLRPAHCRDAQADDHKTYYPGSHRIAMRYTGRPAHGPSTGVAALRPPPREIAKRVDIAATAIFNAMTVDAGKRPRPVLHPAARQPLGCPAGWRPRHG